MVEQPIRYRSYESDIDGREQGIADASFRPRPYAFGRTAQDDYHSGDSVPLFLSDPDGEPDPAEFEYETRFRAPRRLSISTKILMATMAASAVAVVCAWFSSDAMRDVLISARASIATVLPVPSAAARADASTQQLTSNDVQLKDPSRTPSPADQAAGADPNPQSQVAMLPSREEISSAYQTALQSRAPAPAAAAPPQAEAASSTSAPPQSAAPLLAAVSPVAVVPAAPAAAPAVPRMDPDELATLMQRAKGFLDTGDLPSARLLLERAAEAQDLNATLLLAQTYDPDVLGTSDVRNVVAEPAKARAWYQKAAQLGSADAQRRLAQLAN